MKSILVIFAAAFLALFGSAGVAGAHSELESSDPAAGGEFEAPLTAVTLVFNQQIEPSFAALTVTGIDGIQWAAEGPVVEQARVRAEVGDGIPPGRYTVAYRVVSEDGHPISGSYEFDLIDRSRTPAQANVAGVPPAAASTPAPTPSGNNAIKWSLAGTAGVLLVVGSFLALRGTGKKNR
ncbi:copper resistance CopC family protein [Antrihabitans spumae]|uniref:Copper resistance protein CopC n=1 Tax=Antrihabitans spumae TaxID=3373370 RepID=A0ABW7JZW8_9NOCA